MVANMLKHWVTLLVGYTIVGCIDSIATEEYEQTYHDDKDTVVSMYKLMLFLSELYHDLYCKVNNHDIIQSDEYNDMLDLFNDVNDLRCRMEETVSDYDYNDDDFDENLIIFFIDNIDDIVSIMERLED